MDASTRVAAQNEVEKTHSDENPANPTDNAKRLSSRYTIRHACPKAHFSHRRTGVRNLGVLPPGYADAPEKNYPVVYVVDGDCLFGVAAHMGYFQIVGGDLPPVISSASAGTFRASTTGTFGVTAISSLNRLRCFRDRVGRPNFLAFIETELIPFINANYWSDPGNQIIGGASGGGFFVLYALLQKPGLFRGIVSGSPGHWVRPSILNNLEQQFAASGQPLPATGIRLVWVA